MLFVNNFDEPNQTIIIIIISIAQTSHSFFFHLTFTGEKILKKKNLKNKYKTKKTTKE